ncbi:MAG: DNA methyltransferase [Oscillatoriales cyanobacterium CG2_30_40_61]|nr:MAG: DNA methyltransferase [Oscillatoriales cyanobacterium CG2_30_40_61]
MNGFITYLKEIETDFQAGNATEHTHRPALKKLIESLTSSIRVTNEPKRIQCGSPDFVITQGQIEIGHIEAKDIGISLNKVEKTAQMSRYLNGLGNLILTDYLEFRWYVRGEHRLTASIATIDKKNKLKINPEGIEQTTQLFNEFLQTKTPKVTTPKELAKRMASLAQLIRDAIATALNEPDQGGMLKEQLESFQKVLIRDLTKVQFADMYAQTICYGLFAARCNTNNLDNFSRENAAFRLPKTNPFLRSIFGQIAGPDLDDRITWAVDTLATILQQTDMAEILKDFGKRTRREDPVVHFYETFLAAYDPKMRESRGVYYTPEPVVSYIVNSVDYILKHKFNIAKGLADSTKIKIPNPKGEGTIDIHQVLILDPAVGTGMFMHSVINHIYDNFKAQKGMWSSYVTQHLLPRLFGFELLMAPYTVAHMKLGLQLQELGYDFNSDERLRIYLTNTLQEAFQIPAADGFMNRIRDEAEAAKAVKEDVPVMVVLGNPPYSYESVNTDPWIVGLVRDYYQVDGQPLGERNPKGLLDDYVKFIRFAQHRVAETGYGIVALITNHGYLDNPTFRGMRQNLMQTFDEIYVLDLHGNSKKKEVCPDSSPDQNVFDIQQGVAIGIFVKYKDSSQKIATVYHADLWGVREIYENKQLVGGKYHWLAENDISSTQWTEILPQQSFYLFKVQERNLELEYKCCFKINEIMAVNSDGIVTARDNFTLSNNYEDIWKRVNDFLSLNNEEARIKYEIGKDTQDWQVNLAKKDLINSDINPKNIIKISYRPFDYKYTYYTGKSGGFHSRPRGKVMSHLICHENLALITTRQITNLEFCHVLSTEFVTEKKCGSHDRASYIFPLYLYPTNTPTLFNPEPTNAPGGRRPNLDPEFITNFSRKLGLEFIADGKGDQQQIFGPEDIFNYIYAVFHAPTYRRRYAEFLKIDFPRLPLTSNPELFWKLTQKGDRLVNLHLIKETAQEITTYPQPGDNNIDKIRYTEPQNQTLGKVWINKTQYFEGVPPEVWNFQVGGYQVCQKWLKDRVGRTLNYDDLTQYQNIISALSETILLMQEIDQIIAKNGGFPML